MQYRKLKGDGLFDGKQLLKDKVLVLNPTGQVEGIVPAEEGGEGVESFSGILMPGMVNTHCHLELSHFRNGIPSKTGLVNFLKAVIARRKEPVAGKEAAAEGANREMEENGIVAVGDICNTTDALEVKRKSGLWWQNLVEVLNILDESLVQKMALNEAVRQQHLEAGLSAQLTPHAPYSVSKKTFHLLNERTRGGLISVHNQETEGENELFLRGSGNLLELYRYLGINALPIEVTGKRSLPSWIARFTEGQTILLVHNTFTEEADLLIAAEHARKYGLHLVYCLCPNANLYIEDRLPPAELLLRQGCTVTLGTDSYSSNAQLSISAEMSTLRRHFPQLPLEALLTWATANGAQALGWKEGGTFQKGKRPGVLLLEETEHFRVRRLA